MVSSDSLKTVVAGSGNRAVAFLIDYVLVVIAGSSAAASIESVARLPAPMAVLVVALVYFAGMPLTPWQGTLGKWICHIKLCDRAGKRLSFRSCMLRTVAMLGWFALAGLVIFGYTSGKLGNEAVTGAFLALLLPWAPILFRVRGESVFDTITGSLVVPSAAGEKSVAEAGPGPKVSYIKAGVAVSACILFGLALSVPVTVMHEMNRRARVAYAIGETAALREQIQSFHAREKRWPTAQELGVAEATAYPHGGGYRLQGDGTVRIEFAVLPELKGHSLTYIPTPSSDGKTLEWKCSADPGFARQFLPATCR